MTDGDVAGRDGPGEDGLPPQDPGEVGHGLVGWDGADLEEPGWIPLGPPEAAAPAAAPPEAADGPGEPGQPGRAPGPPAGDVPAGDVPAGDVVTGGLLAVGAAPPAAPPVPDPAVQAAEAAAAARRVLDGGGAEPDRALLVRTAAGWLAEQRPLRSARYGMVPWQRVFTVVVALVALGLLVGLPAVFVVGVLVVANLAFAVGFTFRVATTLAGVTVRRRRRGLEREVAAERARRGRPAPGGAALPDGAGSPDGGARLPRYTVLVPVLHEAHLVPRLLAGLDRLAYPRDRLQVLMLVEAADTATLDAFEAARPPGHVRVLVVPAGQPRTKPRACNYGLLFADGEYLVIYDAEDRPDPDQLLRAAAAFAAVRAREALEPRARRTACLQAALNYDNTATNVLTRLFALEYSAWFDGMLPGMDALGLPIPLGGTSNHFRTDLLRAMGGWDPFNVTEDADLGLRAADEGYRVGVLDSTTWEEACSKVRPWTRQRTRWIKGYLVTSMVHLRRPFTYLRATGLRGAVVMGGLVLGTPAMFLAYPLVWATTLATYVGAQLPGLRLPGWAATAAVANMVVGNASVIALSAALGWSRHGWRIAGYALLSPVYWFLHAFAAWRAVVQTARRPFHWEKTPHGLVHARPERARATWAPGTGGPSPSGGAPGGRDGG